MRRIYSIGLLMVTMMVAINLNAQLVSTFEENVLEADSFWNGDDGSGSFTSGMATFTNFYNSDWAAWSGFAYSNGTDVTTASFANQYSAITGSGVAGSANYAVCYAGASDTIKLDGSKVVNGMYVTNSTYAALSMQNGDDFAKKFGGATGNDADWFLLTVNGYNANNELIGSVDFYLADYRFDDNTKDFIVKDWQFVDLSSLGKVNYLSFDLASSDVGAWGMNTPGYFCLDDFMVKDFTEVTFTVNDGTDALEAVNVEFAGETLTTDINGMVVFSNVSPTTEMTVNASKEGYSSYQATIDAYRVTEQTISLAVLAKDITFVVNDGTNVLEAVNVEFTGETLTTDINGAVVFESVTPTTEMLVTATKEGYEDYSATIDAISADTHTISLIINSVDDINSTTKLYPNPAFNQITVEASTEINTVKVYSLSGKLIKQVEVMSRASVTISIAEFESGIYIIEANTKLGSLQKRLIKQ